MQIIKNLDTYTISDSNEVYALKGQLTILTSGKKNINFEVFKDKEIVAKVYINPEHNDEDQTIKSICVFNYTNTNEADEFIYNSIINIEKLTIK